MTDSIAVTTIGEREIAGIFDTFPQHLHQALLERITGLTGELADRVRAAVPRRTGRLAGEIVSRVRDTPQKITGVVTLSGDFAKAGALEYGAHRPAQVHAHSMRLAHAWANAMRSPELVDVPTYTRTPDISATRFLRGSEAAIAAEVESALVAVVDNAASE